MCHKRRSSALFVGKTDKELFHNCFSFDTSFIIDLVLFVQYSDGTNYITYETAFSVSAWFYNNTSQFYVTFVHRADCNYEIMFEYLNI